MTRGLLRWAMAAAITSMMPALAYAHVSISPSQSMQGATEKYTVRVPTEGKVATIGAEVDIPEGVVFEVVSVPNGWKYELKRDASNRVTGIVWTMNIPPGEFAEFSFVARNPRDKAELVWGLRQRLADGKVDDFTKGPNGIRPTAITKLTPRPQQ
jgi:uncharacterized protein YcnI